MDLDTLISPSTDTELSSTATLNVDEYGDADLETLLDSFFESTDRDASHTPDNIPITEFEDFSVSIDDQTLEEILNQEAFPVAQCPPSSVIRANDPEARSDQVFDSDLQYSSPSPGSNQSNNPSDDSLLSHDVDWKPVRERTQIQRPISSTPSSNTKSNSQDFDPTPTPNITRISQSQLSEPGRRYTPDYSIGKVLLKPYKTFFGLQEMIDTKKSMYKNQPDVVFELYARVSYSSREKYQHKQHFQFRELLKDCPPYLNGVLTGFEVAGAVDLAAQKFLVGTRKIGMKCFCRSKLRPDKHSPSGWFIHVLAIRTTTWQEVRGSLTSLGRDDLDAISSSSHI